MSDSPDTQASEMEAPDSQPHDAAGDDSDGPSAIETVPEPDHTAASLGIELPEDPDAREPLLLREVSEARSEADELLSNLQRVTAEYDNFRKRTERDRLENVRRAGQRVIESLLPALDSLDAAMTIEATTPAETSMLEGIEGTHALLLEALKGDNFEPIAAVGEPFDPEFHEAISVIPGDGEQVVVEQVRKGYTMGGRVLRPTLVVVGHA